MRTTERLRGLKQWLIAEACEGREMKAPGSKMDLGTINRIEPTCYLGWSPSKLNEGQYQTLAESVCPALIVLPRRAFTKYTEEKRFDRYNNIHRPQEMGQHLNVDVLFSVYEPGTRLPGFIDSMDEKGCGADMSLLLEATEQGVFTLLNWMDDVQEKLLGTKMIPHTDLAVEEDSITYSLYTDQNYVVDRRPIYYGFVSIDFLCYANERANNEYDKFLK